MHLEHVALRRGDFIGYVRDGRDDVHVEFAVEAFLDDLHVQQAEKSAAEAEAQRQRTFGLERERGIVELQFFERSPQVFVLVGFDGIDAREDHRFHILETGDGLRRGVFDRSDRIAHLDVRRSFDTRTDIAHVPGTDFVAGLHLELQHAHLVGVVLAARVEEFDMLALADRAVEDAEIGDDAPEGVEHRVEDQCLQRSVRIALRLRNPLDDGFEHLFHAQSRFAGGAEDLVRVTTQQIDYLILHFVDHRRVHVDLVQYGNDLQVVLDSQVKVRYGLRLDTLRGIDYEQSPFARGDGTRYLIGKVHVARSVDQVEHVFFAVAGQVFHLDRMALDGDALFALQVHVVQDLGLHFPLVERIGLFQQAVGQCRFAVVDVGYDAKIAYVFHCRVKSLYNNVQR